MSEAIARNGKTFFSLPDWNTLFDAIPHPSLVLDRDHSIIAANLKTIELLKKPVSEMLGMKCWELFHNNTRPPEQCRFEKMLLNGSVEKMEMEIEAFGGWYIVSCTPIIGNSGDLDGVIHIAVDITDRKSLESRLDHSAKEYRDVSIMFETIFDAIPDIIGIQDLDHRMVRYNKAGYVFLQSSPESVNGKKCFKLIGRESPCDVCATSEVYRTKKPSRIERHVPEISRWFEVRAYPVLGKDGKMEKVIEHLRDITDVKKAEKEKAEMERHRRQLEKLESIGVLSGGIAHDFNNLLGGIFGCIDLAKLVNTNPQVQQYLEIALATMNRARSLTQQLNTFAEGGSPQKKVWPLESFLNETARLTLTGSKVSLSMAFESGLWQCEFDSNQMAQVIDNIIINAKQAMPNGGFVTIKAQNKLIEKSTRPGIQEGRYVEIAISDTGIGIPASIIGKIFDPFFTTKQIGSGLGLATSYSIVKKHGGYIEVKSEPNMGATFTVLLPASDKGAKESRPETNRDLSAGTGRILVMDDEDVIREIMSAMLRHYGFDPVLFADGKAAIDGYEKSVEEAQPFAAIFLDIAVPGGMGGKDVVQYIRKKDKKIPIIVISGYSDDPIMQTPKEFGFTDSIKKPFNMKELIDLLRKYLKESKTKNYA